MTAAQPPFPLDAQRAKLDRILDDRIKLYRLTASKQPAKIAEMSAKHAECDAIRRTFAWFVENSGWIREAARERLEQAARERAHADALAEISNHPAAVALRETFPDAAVTVRDMPRETIVDAIETEQVE